jgi:hypothetical protein
MIKKEFHTKDGHHLHHPLQRKNLEKHYSGAVDEVQRQNICSAG